MASDALNINQLASAITSLVAGYALAEVKLYANALTPTSTTTVDEFTFLDDAWATPQQVTYNQVFRNDDNSIEVRCDSVQFDHNGTDDPVVVQGYAVVLSNTLLLHSAALDEPRNMASSLDSLIVQPGFKVLGVEYES
jgi:hypothetical protein